MFNTTTTPDVYKQQRLLIIVSLKIMGGSYNGFDTTTANGGFYMIHTLLYIS